MNNKHTVKSNTSNTSSKSFMEEFEIKTLTDFLRHIEDYPEDLRCPECNAPVQAQVFYGGLINVLDKQGKIFISCPTSVTHNITIEATGGN